MLGPQQSSRTNKEELQKRIQAAFEKQKQSARFRREQKMALAQGDFMYQDLESNRDYMLRY